MSQRVPGSALERLVNVTRELRDDDYSFPLVDEAEVIEPARVELESLLRERDELREALEAVTAASDDAHQREFGWTSKLANSIAAARAVLSKVTP